MKPGSWIYPFKHWTKLYFYNNLTSSGADSQEVEQEIQWFMFNPLYLCLLLLPFLGIFLLCHCFNTSYFETANSICSSICLHVYGFPIFIFLELKELIKFYFITHINVSKFSMCLLQNWHCFLILLSTLCSGMEYAVKLVAVITIGNHFAETVFFITKSYCFMWFRKSQ